MTKNNQLTTGGAVVFKDTRGKRKWFLVRTNEDDDWEIPKVAVRKGESSVRAVLRFTGEVAGMNTRVLEEAGRNTGLVTINGKTIPQKYYFYLLIYKAGSEILGFSQSGWFEYAEAAKKLGLKREKDALKNAKQILKVLEKENKIN